MVAVRKWSKYARAPVNRNRKITTLYKNTYINANS